VKNCDIILTRIEIIHGTCYRDFRVVLIHVLDLVCPDENDDLTVAQAMDELGLHPR